MKFHFHIHYFTEPAQSLINSGKMPQLGHHDLQKAPHLIHEGNGHWIFELSYPSTEENSKPPSLSYKYYVVDAEGTVRRSEWGAPHEVMLPDDVDYFTLNDFWQPEPPMSYLYTSAFTQVLLKVPDSNQPIGYKAGDVVLQVMAPMVNSNQQVGVTGDIKLFGQWDPHRPLKLTPGKFPYWYLRLEAQLLPPSSHYKFVLVNRITGHIEDWEWGEPRQLNRPFSTAHHLTIYSSLSYRHQEIPWKGAGVSIPVFSLRSDSSWGCGDFGDLSRFMIWTAETGQRLVQLLPVNDTTLTRTWQDSYPYNVISVHALHLLYLSPSDLPTLKNKNKQKELEQEAERLNQLPDMDYEGVIKLKETFIKALYEERGAQTLQSKDFHHFFQANKDWLMPYAVFCYLRDSLNEWDFHRWGAYATYSEEVIEPFFDTTRSSYQQVAIYLFIQFLLHHQLMKAKETAYQKGIVLKGDIPIGVNRYGVEVWSHPELFNTHVQIGAPPDDFSSTGQNWGFPAYRWDEMAKKEYAWWKRRLSHMGEYMDAFRIDHILGFFRSWEIPDHSVQGLLGQFNPALPFSEKELQEKGFDFSPAMTEPYIDDKELDELFGEHTDLVRNHCLDQTTEGRYRLKPSCSTQRAVQEWLSKQPASDLQASTLQDGLFRLCNDVLFVRDAADSTLLHPRITAQETYWYQSLSADQQAVFNHLYDDFFYHRHLEYWRQKALDKLTPLIQGTAMLPCGEDLGMIPACVPSVMKQLQILSLELQRMPKTPGVRFENLNSIPYLSICTTSTHDMNPLRAWWTEDNTITTLYYQQVLCKQGLTPLECTPEISQDIIRLHLASPAMWVIIPWQDWIGIDWILRHPDPQEERINNPADPQHHWKYRMHLTIEQLVQSNKLNVRIMEMIRQSGR
jgi:4-alpha-glucanotransferase